MKDRKELRWLEARNKFHNRAIVFLMTLRGLSAWFLFHAFCVVRTRLTAGLDWARAQHCQTKRRQHAVVTSPPLRGVTLSRDTAKRRAHTYTHTSVPRSRNEKHVRERLAQVTWSQRARPTKPMSQSVRFRERVRTHLGRSIATWTRPDERKGAGHRVKCTDSCFIILWTLIFVSRTLQLRHEAFSQDNPFQLTKQGCATKRNGSAKFRGIVWIWS